MYLSIHLSIYLSVCLSVCLFTYVISLCIPSSRVKPHEIKESLISPSAFNLTFFIYLPVYRSMYLPVPSFQPAKYLCIYSVSCCPADPSIPAYSPSMLIPVDTHKKSHCLWHFVGAQGKKLRQAAVLPPCKELGALGSHLCADEVHSAGDNKIW